MYVRARSLGLSLSLSLCASVSASLSLCLFRSHALSLSACTPTANASIRAASLLSCAALRLFPNYADASCRRCIHRACRSCAPGHGNCDFFWHRQDSPETLVQTHPTPSACLLAGFQQDDDCDALSEMRIGIGFKLTCWSQLAHVDRFSNCPVNNPTPHRKMKGSANKVVGVGAVLRGNNARPERRCPARKGCIAAL